jgi:hypothetical protein
LQYLLYVLLFLDLLAFKVLTTYRDYIQRVQGLSV